MTEVTSTASTSAGQNDGTPVSHDRLEGWEARSSSGDHFSVLDGIRGVAILLVVAFHSLYTNPAHGSLSRVAGYIIRAGWVGVPIFFVLSGFLISYTFFKGRAQDPRYWYPRGYTWRRMAKILPPFYLSILIFLALYWWFYRDPAYFTAAWKWATGMANFSSIPVPFNLSYWSLIVEAHFYIVLPLLFWATRGLSTRHTTVVLFGVLVLVPFAVRHFTWPHGVDVLPAYPADLYRDVTLELTRFPCQLDYFGWGVAFGGIFVQLGKVSDLRPLSVLGYMGLLLVVVTLLSLGYWSEHFSILAQPTRWSVEIGHFLPGLAAMLTLFFVFDPTCLGFRVLSIRWLRFIGLVSYEWFLFHGPVVSWFHENTGPSQGNIFAYAWRTVVPLAITFGFSVMFYRMISLPILNSIRRRLAAQT